MLLLHFIKIIDLMKRTQYQRGHFASPFKKIVELMKRTKEQRR